MSGVRIDNLSPTGSPSPDHEFPAMREGATVKLTVAQVMALARAFDNSSAGFDGDPATYQAALEAVAAVLGGHDDRYLRQSENLADLDDAEAARGNIGLGYADVAAKAAFQANIGLREVRKWLQDTFNRTSTSLADVPDLNFDALAGETWGFEFHVQASGNGTDNGRPQFAVNGPASDFFVVGGFKGGGDGASMRGNRQTSLDTVIGGWNASGDNNELYLVMSGVIQPTANGTVTLRMARAGGSGTATAYKGSLMRAWRLD